MYALLKEVTRNGDTRYRIGHYSQVNEFIPLAYTFKLPWALRLVHYMNGGTDVSIIHESKIIYA